jgi:hypothetical protein
MDGFGKSSKQRIYLDGPAPVGEAVEGNAESDWAAWADSVAFQDSQYPDSQFQETQAQELRPENDLQEDAFSSVRLRGG